MPISPDSEASHIPLSEIVLVVMAKLSICTPVKLPLIDRLEHILGNGEQPTEKARLVLPAVLLKVSTGCLLDTGRANAAITVQAAP